MSNLKEAADLKRALVSLEQTFHQTQESNRRTVRWLIAANITMIMAALLLAADLISDTLRRLEAAGII